MPLDQDITDTSPDYDVRLPQWEKVRDCLEGEDTIKDGGTAYLPQPRGMKKIDFKNYLQRANFYGVSGRTLGGLVGLVFRIDPVIDIPSQLESMRELASPEGFTMQEIVREARCEVLSLGRYGLLVDMPQIDNAMPYIATWKAEDIFRWEEKIELTTGFRKLSRVVLQEEPLDSNETTTTYIRELFLDETGIYQQQRWARVQDEASTPFSSATLTPGSFERVGELITPKRFNQPLREIPFFFANTFDKRARTTKPPMIDLVNVNLGHYRNSADYETALHIIGSPTPYVFGIRSEDRPTTFGPAQIWHSVSKDVKAGMIEYTGTGVTSIRLAMEDKEKRMAVLGARLIRGEDRENMSSETTRLNAREETSVLLSGVRTVEQVFTAACQFAAGWKGGNKDAVKFRLNRDFVETRLTSEELTALVKSWQEGALSDEVYHYNLQRGEIMPAERTLEEEKAAREAEHEERATKNSELAASAAAEMAEAMPAPAAPAGKAPAKKPVSRGTPSKKAPPK